MRNLFKKFLFKNQLNLGLLAIAWQFALIDPALADTLELSKTNSLFSISVCSEGCDFNDLQKAITAAESGAVIRVSPEIYHGCAVVNKTVHLIGRDSITGQRAHLQGGVCSGKAPLVITARDAVIEGFEISDIAVAYGNGACVRLDAGSANIVIRDIDCHDNQEGVLGASEGLLLIENSEFVRNGLDGQAHGIYISGGNEVVIRNCKILSSKNAGHSLKSGARKLTVLNSIIAALEGHNSRAVDAYAGGELVLLNNIIQQGPLSENDEVIGFGLELKRLVSGNHSFFMQGNLVIRDPAGRGELIQGRQLGQIQVLSNTLVGLNGLGMSGIDESKNQWFKTRKLAGLPEFDGTLASLFIKNDKSVE
jgi:hypothetical protein